MTITETRCADLRTDLIRLAQLQSRKKELASLRGRYLAAQAGCAVAAIYNVYADMTDLVLAVNCLTFARISAKMAGAVTGRTDLPPEPWRALFDVRLPEDATVPDWCRRDLTAQFAVPVSQLFQDLY